MHVFDVFGIAQVQTLLLSCRANPASYSGVHYSTVADMFGGACAHVTFMLLSFFHWKLRRYSCLVCFFVMFVADVHVSSSTFDPSGTAPKASLVRTSADVARLARPRSRKASRGEQLFKLP